MESLKQINREQYRELANSLYQYIQDLFEQYSPSEKMYVKLKQYNILFTLEYMIQCAIENKKTNLSTSLNNSHMFDSIIVSKQDDICQDIIQNTTLFKKPERIETPSPLKQDNKEESLSSENKTVNVTTITKEPIVKYTSKTPFQKMCKQVKHEIITKHKNINKRNIRLLCTWLWKGNVKQSNPVLDYFISSNRLHPLTQDEKIKFKKNDNHEHTFFKHNRTNSWI